MAKMLGVLGVVFGLSFTLSTYAEGRKYLVQFKSSKTFQALAAQQSHVSNPNDFSQFSGRPAQFKLLNADANVVETLNGIEMMVIESDDAQAIASLKNHPAIALVEEEHFHPAPKPLATWGQQDSTPLAIRKRMARPWGIDAVKAPQAWSASKGAGARVMVLDTGIDEAHDSLASRFEKGRNFTTADATAYADDNGHGTHVAGTILADGRAGGLVGVAPQARVLAGKVCGEQGCSSIAVASGINWAIEERVDVVNMSLGGSFISEAEAQALRRAEETGVFIAAASGNNGNGRVSYPAAFPSVFAVGAVDSTIKKADFSQWGPELDIVAPGVDVISSVPRGSDRSSTAKINLDGKGFEEIPSMPFVGSPVRGLAQNNLAFAGLGKAAGFTGVDVRGKFALISRGEIPFAEKVANAIQNGAAGVVIYNNVAGLMQGTLSDDGSEVSVPVVLIEKQVGEAAKLALASGGQVEASFAISRTDFASFQGTSMACPHVAGVAALVRSANKALTPAQVRDLLKATARPLSPNTNNEYGSGMIDAEAAVSRVSLFNVSGVWQLAN